MKFRTATAYLPNIIDHARSYVGLRSRAFKVNTFGERLGVSGKPWDGSFLETVLRELGYTTGVSLVSSTAALAYFNRENRIFHVPRNGDLVFFAWSTDGDGFGPPHVGLVTDASEFKKNGVFRTVEGMVDPGLPKGHKEQDGVYERVRTVADVLAFARPVYRTVRPSTSSTEKLPVVKTSDFRMNRVNRSVVLLQTALFATIGAYGFERGKFDRQTQSAVLRFQRECGFMDGDGLPDYRTLVELSARSGLFSVKLVS